MRVPQKILWLIIDGDLLNLSASLNHLKEVMGVSLWIMFDIKMSYYVSITGKCFILLGFKNVA